ncbi:MAG: hypothetical protein ABSG76_26160 [Xanthobacteraceae bacterium]
MLVEAEEMLGFPNRLLARFASLRFAALTRHRAEHDIHRRPDHAGPIAVPSKARYRPALVAAIDEEATRRRLTRSARRMLSETT